MNINYNNRIKYKNCYLPCRTNVTQPSFKGVETLTHTNIGSCLEGYVGKVFVRKPSGEKALVNVFKEKLCTNYENYSIKNDSNDVLGEMAVAINKYQSNEYLPWMGNPNHVFVSELRNYSNPNTPYYKKGLDYHKDIGTRLLQIAQRRSDEAQCEGNIKLISKNESKEWYKRVIGMTEEFPEEQNLKFKIHNPNSMVLPPHAKEPLSKLQGGL